MRGLIAAALGGLSKGVGQVATAQIEINARKALMEAEEEMRDRLAEAAEGRDEKRQIAAEGRAEAQQIAAEGRAISNIPLTAEATAKAEETNMRRPAKRVRPSALAPLRRRRRNRKRRDAANHCGRDVRCVCVSGYQRPAIA